MALGWNRRCFKNTSDQEFQTYLSGSAESSEEGLVVGTVHGFTPEASARPGAMAKHRALWSILLAFWCGKGGASSACGFFFIFTDQVLPGGSRCYLWVPCSGSALTLALVYLNSLPPSWVPALSQEHLVMERRTCKPNLSASLCSVLLWHFQWPYEFPAEALCSWHRADECFLLKKKRPFFLSQQNVLQLMRFFLRLCSWV